MAMEVSARLRGLRSGELVGAYRKLHLSEEEGFWETSHYLRHRNLDMCQPKGMETGLLRFRV